MNNNINSVMIKVQNSSQPKPIFLHFSPSFKCIFLDSYISKYDLLEDG